jgi:hypothetical protein
MKGWIYFLQFGNDGPIKVGRSYNPEARARDLNSTSPVELILLGAMRSPNMVREERAFQDKLSGSHIRGEWFEQAAVLSETKKLGVRVKGGATLSTALRSDPTATEGGRAAHFSLRLPGHLVEAVAKAAKLDGRSLNSMFEVIITQWAMMREAAKPRARRARAS